MADDTPIILRRHGNPEGPRIVFSHGNGLAADSYFPFWSLLTHRFDVFVFDLRSHGWNPVSDLRAHNIPTLVDDIACVLRAIDSHFGAKPKVGVFHSLAALLAVLHATRERGFSALVLFDPPICPPAGAPEDLEVEGQMWGAAAARRASRYETREEYSQALRRSRIYRRLLPGVADIIADTTLRPAADGGYELCCPREHEAQICAYLFGWAMQVDLDAVSCPTKAIGADPTLQRSFMPSMELSALRNVDYDFIPDTTHSLLLENPEACVDLLLGFLEQQGGSIGTATRATHRADAAVGQRSQHRPRQ